MIKTIVASSLRLRNLIVAFAAVLAVGVVWQLSRVPLDVVPEFSPVHMTVKTEALGLSSSEVEALITVPIEADLLNGVPWLEKIESESITGLSSIELTFVPGTDYLKARQMVQERLTQAHALPNVSKPPTLLQPVSSASRVMNVGLSSKTVSLIDMSVLSRWTIVPRLLAVPGVANVAVWGFRDHQMQVLVDPAELSKRDITLEQVVKTAGEAVWASPLTYLNSSTPGSGGFIDTPNQRLNLRHKAPIQTAKEFAKVPVYGTSIALGEVTKVVEDHQPLIGDALLKGGQTGLLLVIDKFPGYNTQDVTAGVDRALRELKPGMTGIDVDTSIYRPAGFLERATGNINAAFAAGGILLILAMGLLLGDWRSIVVAVVSVALSYIAAVATLRWFGVGANMMLLAGLLTAIAVVVHEAVLNVTAIRRRMGEAVAAGTRPSMTRIIVGAVSDARGPMLYASLIVVIAVLPILFMQGLSAAFFKPLILAYVVAVAAALVVSMVVGPPLMMLLAPSATARAAGTGAAPRLVEPLLRRYEAVMQRTLATPTTWFVVAVVALAASYAIWVSLNRSMLPSFKETDLVVDIEAAPGTSLPAMNQATAALMKNLQGIPGVQNVASQIGRAILCNCDDTADVNSAEVWVSLDPSTNYNAAMAAISQAVKSAPGLTGQVQTYLSKKMRNALTGAEEKLTVRVYGQELDILRSKAAEIKDVLAKTQGVKNPTIEESRTEQAIEVEVDLDRAARYGLKPGDVRRAVSALVSGITVGALFQDQKVFDVVVWGVPGVRSSLEDIQNIRIDTDEDKTVRLGDVANVKIGNAESVIRRQGVSRRIDVDADVSGRSIGEVTREVAQKISQIKFPYENHAQVLGEHVERRSALRSIYPHLATAAVLIFLLLQAAMGSWRLAALSALGIPVAMLGGFVAAAIAGGNFALGSLLGLVAVLGFTVHSSLMMVRHFQQLEQSGAESFGEMLVRRGVQEQFTSVVATAIIVIAAVLPIVVYGNVGGLEIAHPMAVVILGGMITSTVVTLFMTPALYLKYGTATAVDALQLETQS